jgi:hypothetical protein
MGEGVISNLMTSLCDGLQVGEIDFPCSIDPYYEKRKSQIEPLEYVQGQRHEDR